MKHLFLSILKAKNSIHTVLLVLISGIILTAQQINIQVVVTPPYSNKLEDYIDRGNNVIITVTNTSATVQQFKLLPNITGNNGVMAMVREDFLPASPIIMSPGETRTFTYNQLRVFNSNLQQNDLILQGVSFRALENTGMLPEGTYTLCIRAIQYGGTAQLSGSTGGCSSFHITAYDPPMIIVPQQNAVVQMPQPQLMNFQWTPSGISGKTRYTIKIADITSLNIFNPNDAFNNPSIIPYFEQSNIIASVFPYDMSKPKLFKNRQYAVQIIAYDTEGKLSYKNEGQSQAHLFSVSDMTIIITDTDPTPPVLKEFKLPFVLKDKDSGDGGGGSNIPIDPNDSPDCMNAGACQVSEPECTGTITPVLGAIVNVGKFQMKINQIQGNSGSGEIEVPYMQTKVDVAFQNLTMNGNNEACGASLVWVKSAQQQMIPEQMLKEVQGNFSDQGIDWLLVNQHIQQQNKKVSLFNINQSPKTLPFILDLGAGELTLLGMVFTPTAAYANVAFSAPIPVGNQQQHFSMGLKGICIRPNGFGIAEADARLTLASQLSIPVGQNILFTMEGGGNGSYVKFDCKGVTEVKLKGGIEIERSLVLPVDNNMNIVPAPAKFKVNFDGVAASIKDWIVDATASHPAMTTAEGNGFKIGFEKLIIDFSKTKNPQGMDFPENHPMHNSPVKSSWTGVILSNPIVNLPDYLKKSDNQSIQINVGSIVLDGEGLWTKVAVENVIDKLDDGSFGGWGFAIHQFNLDIQKSELKGGGLAGAVNIPITEVGVGFDASYQAGTQNTDMEIMFGVNLKDQMDIDMIFAKASLHQGSELKIEIQQGKASPSAILHGSLTIGWNKDSDKKPADDENNDVASFELPTLNFQGLSVFNGDNDLPNLSLQSMQLANLNSQGKLAGFPIKLAGNPGFENDGNGTIGFNLALEFSLSKANPNGLKGNTDFTIFAKYSPEKRRFAYDRTQLNCISLENLDIAVAKLSGGICIYKDDPEWGNGFSGSLEATIKGVDISVQVALGVGNVDDYDYFYFEGLVRLPGIPVSASMSLYGFGGGFHYNMDRAKLDPITQDQYPANNPVPEKPGPGYSPSGVKYSPSKGTVGFNATVVFGLSGGVPSAAAFNGDLTLWMKITESHGIESLGFDGNGYLVQPLNERGDAVIKGNFEVVIDFKNKTFDMGVELTMKLGDVLDGDGSIVMHASQEEWFIYFGRWDTKADKNSYKPWEDSDRINVNAKLGPLKSSFNLYFMMGSIKPELPPLPYIIAENLGLQEDGSTFEDSRISFPSHNPNKPGFAFGAGFQRQAKIEIAIFYADINFAAGFDLMFFQKFEGDCSHLGINGWRAEGQAYAYLGLEAGLRLDLWIYEGDFKLIDFKLAALIYAQFPNPSYVYANVRMKANVLNGLIKVDKQVKFELGQKAQCGSGQSPFADLPIIEEIQPGHGEEVEVYDDIRVAFNYPNKIFKVFNEEFPDEPSRFYYYKLDKVELKKGNQKIQMQAEPIYTKDGYSAKFPTFNNELFPEKSELKLEIVVSGYEYIKNKADKLVVTEPSYKVSFKTKKKPDHVPASQMLAANPSVRQRFHLSHDYYHGFLKTIKDFSYLMNKSEMGDPEKFDQSKTEYIAQFLETGTGKIIEVPFSKAMGNKFEFLVPEDLKGSTIYRLRLIARLHPKIQAIDRENMGEFNLASNDGNTGIKEQEIVKGAYKVTRFLKPDNTPKTVDHIISGWYFKTSMYKRLSQKLADYKLEGTTIAKVISKQLIPIVTPHSFIKSKNMPETRYHLPAVMLSGKEAFDKYDLEGYKVGQDQISVQPLLGFEQTSAPGSNYQTGFYSELNGIMTHYLHTRTAYDKNKMKLVAGRDHNHPLFKEIAVNSNIEKVWDPMYTYASQGKTKYTNSMDGTKGDAIWSYHYKNSAYFDPITLPKGKSMWKPMGPLTKEEIDEAIAATNFEKQGGMGLMQFKIKGSPKPMGQTMGGQGMSFSTKDTPVLVLVNISDYLLLQDYHHVLDKGHTTLAILSLFEIQNVVSPFLYRPKGNYTIKWGNILHSTKQINYSADNMQP
jgi:TANFOR domain-containing protein